MKLVGQLGEALARSSKSKIAGGVRGDNWSERLRCRWQNTFFRAERRFPLAVEAIKTRTLNYEGCATRQDHRTPISVSRS